MGMSIDECIDYFLRSYAIDDTDDARQHNEVMEYTIETMRKYQKIEEIIANWEDEKINNIICCLDIEEVVAE